MNLTRDGREKLSLLVIGAVLGAVLGVLTQIFILKWNKPDVRYATAGAYIPPKLGLANIAVKNWGGSDAENIIITASFADPVMSFSTNQINTPFEPSGGGDDKKSVTGTIKRLAPGELVNIYFITDPSSRWTDQTPVIRGIKFNGGLGKTGAPAFQWMQGLIIMGVIWGVMWLGFMYFARWLDTSYARQLSGAIQIGLSAAQQGISEEQLKIRV